MKRTFPRYCVEIRPVPDVQPLGRQLGVAAKKNVPDELSGALFGDSPNSGNLGEVVLGKQEKRFYTYAVLDAAKVPNLALLLEASGLEYKCLFTNKALEDLGDYAPWIVHLEADNSFTRRLFTTDDGVGGLWQLRPGIFVRTSAGLDEVWSFFRKFTRIKDEAGKWFYFRFWEPDYVNTSIQAFNNSETADPAIGTPIWIIQPYPRGQFLK